MQLYVCLLRNMSPLDSMGPIPTLRYSSVRSFCDFFPSVMKLSELYVVRKNILFLKRKMKWVE